MMVLEACGFVGDYKISRRHNAYNHLIMMPYWYYFNHPTHLSLHDFTITITPRHNLHCLLGLGHKFIPLIAGQKMAHHYHSKKNIEMI
jgi:hypothetical protein